VTVLLSRTIDDPVTPIDVRDITCPARVCFWISAEHPRCGRREQTGCPPAGEDAVQDPAFYLFLKGGGRWVQRTTDRKGGQL
jgi:hypothetical protein